MLAETFIFINNECIIYNSNPHECFVYIDSKTQRTEDRKGTGHEVERRILTRYLILRVRNWHSGCYAC
jgi:hypothetical protein